MHRFVSAENYGGFSVKDKLHLTQFIAKVNDFDQGRLCGKFICEGKDTDAFSALRYSFKENS